MNTKMSGYRGKTCAESFEELRKSVQKLRQEIFKLTIKQSLFNKTMKVCKDKVLDLYKNESAEGKALLEKVFGKEVFAGRPLGVWCMIGTRDDYKLVKSEELGKTPSYYQSQAIGVAVVTEDAAFIVAPHNTIVAQWSKREAGRNRCIRDTESLDSLEATDRILTGYIGTKYTDPDGDTQYDFLGAPAAEFCRSYNRKGFNTWDLPTVKQLQIMAKNIKEINACFRAMGCPTLPMGWYWSSIEKDEFCAWYVFMSDGFTDSDDKYYYYYVRAVSAFQI